MGNEIRAEQRRARPIFWWLLGGVLVVAAAAVAAFIWLNRLEARQDAAAKAKRGRELRAAPIAAVALAPLPVKSPFVQREGNDEFGYPRSYVDKRGVRSLLAWKKYAELNGYIEQFQRDFLADFRNEYFVQDAADAFSTPELGPQLEAWVVATPASFAPYLARAAHLIAVGHAARGDDTRAATDASNFEEMRRAFGRANDDLERALALSPRLMPAFRYQLNMAYVGSTLPFREVARRAFEACRACFLVRAMEQTGLRPRWGGSYRTMDAAAASAPVAENPRLRLLPGYAALDRSDTFIHEKQLERALEHVERACKLGGNADFLRQKADILGRLNDFAGARAALTRALELRPSRTDLLFERVECASRENPPDWRSAASDLTEALRIAPTDRDGRRLLPNVVKGLTFIGWEAYKRGDQEQALELLDLAAELDPNRDVESRRSAVLTAGFSGKQEELAALEQAARAAPDDFQARIKLDYALSQSRDWPRILAVWTEYLTRHPGDARAYRERAGTFRQLGRHGEAYADVERACDLGSSAGCNLVRLFPKPEHPP